MECYAILVDNSGTHFDPKVLEALVLRSSEILQLKAGYAVTRRAKGPNVIAPAPMSDTSETAGTHNADQGDPLALLAAVVAKLSPADRERLAALLMGHQGESNGRTG
jgi:hypothetical protein